VQALLRGFCCDATSVSGGGFYTARAWQNGFVRPRTFLLFLLLPTLAFARTRTVVPPRPTAPFRADFLANLDDVQSKIVELAAAMPEEKYNWRPGPGVRSVSEVFMHIAGANYLLSTFLGVEPPAGLDTDLEKHVTRKADVLAQLKKSFEHLRNATGTVTDLETRVKMFGETTTQRGVMMTMLSHLHEHLGQSIAYARMNGVTPPWSR